MTSLLAAVQLGCLEIYGGAIARASSRIRQSSFAPHENYFFWTVLREQIRWCSADARHRPGPTAPRLCVGDLGM